MAIDPSNRSPQEDNSSIPTDGPRPQSSSQSTLNDGREGIEMHEISTHDDDDLDLSSASVSSGESRIVPTRVTSRASRLSRAESKKERKGVWGYVYRFWISHIILTVPQKSNRDHFGMYIDFWLLTGIRTF